MANLAAPLETTMYYLVHPTKELLKTTKESTP